MKKMNNQERDERSSAGFSVKNALLIFLCVAMAVMIIAQFSLFSRLEDMQNEMNNRNQNISNQISRLASEINSIYANIDTHLKQQASLIAGVDYQLGDFDSETHSVQVSFSVVPKALTADTEATLTLNGKTVVLERVGDAFCGTMQVGLFVEYDSYPLLSLENTSGIKTEFLDGVELSALFCQYLPSIYAYAPWTDLTHDGKLKVDLNINLSDAVEDQVQSAAFESFALVEMVNEKEIARRDITAQVKNAGEDYHATYTTQTVVTRGEWVEIIVEAKDSLGYIHKVSACYWYENEDGAIAEVVKGGEEIYDAAGNLLYGEKE